MKGWIAAVVAAALIARAAWAIVAWWAWRDLDRPAYWAGQGQKRGPVL